MNPQESAIHSVIGGIPKDDTYSFDVIVYLDGTETGEIHEGGIAAIVNQHNQIMSIVYAWAAEDMTGHKADIDFTEETVFVVTSPDYAFHRLVKSNGAAGKIVEREKEAPSEAPPEGPETEQGKAPQPEDIKPGDKDDTDPDSVDESKPPPEPEENENPFESSPAPKDAFEDDTPY